MASLSEVFPHLNENNGNVLLNRCQSLNGQKWRGFQ